MWKHRETADYPDITDAVVGMVTTNFDLWDVREGGDTFANTWNGCVLQRSGREHIAGSRP
jgi:hypothetical protein